MDNLEPHIALLLNESNEHRINFIRKGNFIYHTQVNSILTKFSDLVNYPKSVKMQNYLLVGEPDSGKTSLLEEFESRYTVKNIPGLGPKLDVFCFQAPVKADEGRLYGRILEGLNIAHNNSDSAANKLKQVKGIINALDIKVLIVDELHNISSATAAAQRTFLATLKYLTNELKICMICAGIPEVKDVITYDSQLTARFEIIELESWKNKPEEFIAFLKAYERRLPLKEKSNLAQKELAVKIFKLGEGIIGEYCKIIKKLAVQAIQDGTEKIDINLIEKIDYQPRSKREGNK